MTVARLRALVLCLGVLAPRSAPAAPDGGARVRARLEKGRALYEEQDYRLAIRELAPVKRDPAATRAQKLEALELLGLCWFIVGSEDQAREAFEDLLAIDAGYQLREASGSPKIEAFFERVRMEYVPGSPDARASLEHSAPPGAVAGRRVELAADVTSGADVVREVAVKWRRRGELGYQAVAMRRAGGDRWRARFTPPPDPSGYVLEYYVEATDLAGAPVARAGGPETPLALPLRGAAALGAPWYQRWYVWAGTGAAVLGAVAIGAAAASDSAPESTLGTWDLGK